MARAPIGAVISYWSRPGRDRVHIHRIEVEHALYLAAASQEQIKNTLAEMLRQQTESLGRISDSLDDLRDEVAAGFSAVSEGLATIDDTLRQGFYQLHLDAVGTHARLDDLVLLMYDKEAYRRELAARHDAAEARRSLHKVSNAYSDAMVLTKRALNESNFAKARAMLDEAVVMFSRASGHSDFALDAHFQLGYLAQQHECNFEAAYYHYDKALGPDYSSHFVRAARHLAHLDLLTGQKTKAMQRMEELIAHDNAVSAFARDLRMANEKPWEGNACILALKNALETHAPLLARCSRISDLRRQFDDRRSFSATERFMESYPDIVKELSALRPESRVYFDAARYASGSGCIALSVSWIKHCHDAQATLGARRAFLIEAMVDEELRGGSDVQALLGSLWSSAERARIAEAAAARRSAAQRRNAASAENAVYGAGYGAFLGGIVLGFSGCWSCIANAPKQGTLITDFNLFNGLLYGAIGGAAIGALIGVLVGQMKE